MAADPFDMLHDLWPLGVRVDENSVTLLDEHGNDFKRISSRVPGSRTGLLGAAFSLITTLETVKTKWQGGR